MAANFEYWTAVFGVGLDGLSDFDHDELNAIAEQGWEPFQLTAVHGGFAAIVMFRRELEGAARTSSGAAKRTAKKPAAKKATAARKATKKAAGGRR
ncbi:MAG: hypothetical protein ABR540_23010 [Acidimicrobiales bacterium]